MLARQEAQNQSWVSQYMCSILIYFECRSEIHPRTHIILHFGFAQCIPNATIYATP